MQYKIIDRQTKKELSFEQKLIFLKLLAAHGPKRKSNTWAERTLKAYRKAQKDFNDIYGITPEAIYMEEKRWKKYGNH